MLVYRCMILQDILNMKKKKLLCECNMPLPRESFSQGRRRYFVDLRQNQRGRFLKLTMLAGGKTFVAIPGEGLVQFRDALSALLDEFGSGYVVSGGGGSHQGTPPPQDQLPGPREVRAGGKRFYFDCLHNDRGTFLRLSEVGSVGCLPQFVCSLLLSSKILPFPSLLLPRSFPSLSFPSQDPSLSFSFHSPPKILSFPSPPKILLSSLPKILLFPFPRSFSLPFPSLPLPKILLSSLPRFLEVDVVPTLTSPTRVGVRSVTCSNPMPETCPQVQMNLPAVEVTTTKQHEALPGPL